MVFFGPPVDLWSLIHSYGSSAPLPAYAASYADWRSGGPLGALRIYGPPRLVARFSRTGKFEAGARVEEVTPKRPLKLIAWWQFHQRYICYELTPLSSFKWIKCINMAQNFTTVNHHAHTSNGARYKTNVILTGCPNLYSIYYISKLNESKAHRKWNLQIIALSISNNLASWKCILQCLYQIMLVVCCKICPCICAQWHSKLNCL